LAAVRGPDIWQTGKPLHTYSCNNSRLNRHCCLADKKKRHSLPNV